MHSHGLAAQVGWLLNKVPEHLLHHHISHLQVSRQPDTRRCLTAMVQKGAMLHQRCLPRLSITLLTVKHSAQAERFTSGVLTLLSRASHSLAAPYLAALPVARQDAGAMAAALCTALRCLESIAAREALLPLPPHQVRNLWFVILPFYPAGCLFNSVLDLVLEVVIDWLAKWPFARGHIALDV